MRSTKINVRQDDFPNNKWTRCNFPKEKVVLGAPDKINIPCINLMLVESNVNT